MKTQKEILTWLKNNLGPRAVAGLTSTDTCALVTSVGLSNLISYESAPAELFAAYKAIVLQMQPHNRHLAYHAIACELDWSHRGMIWICSDLVHDHPLPTGKCCFESGGGGEERSEQLKKHLTL